MRKRTAAGSIVANPLLIGAVTTLVVVVGVFLAYNANNGLPFVPTYSFNVRVPNADKLVRNNDVREGGQRIGRVAEITPVRLENGHTGAQLRLEIDKNAGPVPVDSKVVIKPRSVLGLKFVDLQRGDAEQTVPQGGTITVGRSALTVELEDLFGMFDKPTRQAIRRNLVGFGNGFAGRGDDINQALAELPGLLAHLTPVMRNLADPRTQLVRFFRESEHLVAVLSPVADELVRGFTVGADTFAALTRYPQDLRELIGESPATLAVGERSLRAQRPFLRHVANISDELRGSARQLRASLPALNSALARGTPVLRATPPLNRRLGDTMAALRDLASSPTTTVALRELTALAGTLNPTLRYVGPYQTVCNYWNYFWTWLGEHQTDRDQTGFEQRIEAKMVPPQTNSPSSYGQAFPANGEGTDPLTTALLGDPVYLHGQPYGAAITDSGAADCESGQRGYLERLAKGVPPQYHIVIDPHTPGVQGPTYTGRPRVPEGETFSREPQGLGRLP